MKMSFYYLFESTSFELCIQLCFWRAFAFFIIYSSTFIMKMFFFAIFWKKIVKLRWDMTKWRKCLNALMCASTMFLGILQKITILYFNWNWIAKIFSLHAASFFNYYYYPFLHRAISKLKRKLLLKKTSANSMIYILFSRTMYLKCIH